MLITKKRDTVIVSAFLNIIFEAGVSHAKTLHTEILAMSHR